MTAPALAGTTRASVVARHPESAAWLALYDTARGAIGDRGWANAVPSPAETPPMIDGVTCAIDARAATRLVRALLRRRDPDDGDACALLVAAVNEHEPAIAAVAARLDMPVPIVATAAALATMPLLQACREAWVAKIPAAWNDAACPVCGAWATLVEARGLDRRLAHRCGRCGADWSAEPVRCGFCGNREHGELTALVSERADERARVEACGACGGYLKTITTLTATPPADVALLDLDTVHLDVAALEHGLHRPPPRPRAASVRVTRARRWL